MLSHLHKKLQKAYVKKLYRYYVTDDAQYGFQDGMNILQVFLDI